MLSKLFMNIINNPDKIKPYRDIIEYYIVNNRPQEAAAFSYLIEVKFNDNNSNNS